MYTSTYFPVDLILNLDNNTFGPKWQEIITICLCCCICTLGADQGLDPATIKYIALHIPDNLEGVILQTAAPQHLEPLSGMLQQLLATSQGPTLIAAELNISACSALLAEINHLYPPSLILGLYSQSSSSSSQWNYCAQSPSSSSHKSHSLIHS